MDSVEEIKQKLAITQVIREYVQLKKAGAANWKGKCPFHNEKTPSFFVSDDKQIFKCFGCGEGGDIFTFIQKIEGCDFPEALRVLANKAGVVLQRQDPKTISLKTRLLDICELATQFWQTQLFAEQGRTALEYLRKRGLSDQTIKDFKLGFALDSWDSLMNFLKSKGFTETEIFQAGLVVQRQSQAGFYDRFRNRIMFPIANLHSHVIGFTGRTLSADEMAKYVNTPESMLYNKSTVLYGLDKAKKEIREKDLAVMVEGNMDVVASHQAGVKNVIACSGTALTAGQLKLISRYSENAGLCFDMDEAGQAAAIRTIDLALSAGLNTKVVQLIDAKDPDDCIQKDPKLWEQAIANSISVMDFYFNKLVKSRDVNNIQEKKIATKEFMQKIDLLPDFVEQDHWLKQLASAINVDVQLLRENLPKKTATPTATGTQEQPKIYSTKAESKYFILSGQFVGLLIKYPDLFSYAIDLMPPKMLADENFAKFYESLLLCYNKKADLEQHVAEQQIVEPMRLKNLELYIETKFEESAENEIKSEFLLTLKELKNFYFNNQIAQLNQEIKKLEQSGAGVGQLDEKLRVLQDLIRQKAQI